MTSNNDPATTPTTPVCKAFHAATLVEVQPGEVLTSIRNRTARFVSAYQSRVSGKVVVEEEDGAIGEYYPRVFGLHEPITAGDEPGRYSGTSPRTECTAVELTDG